MHLTNYRRVYAVPHFPTTLSTGGEQAMDISRASGLRGSWKYGGGVGLTRRCFVHLHSVNKRSQSYVPNTDADDDGVGNKWSLSALWRHLAAEGRTPEQLAAVWASIKSVVRKAFITADSQINTFLLVGAQPNYTPTRKANPGPWA